MSDEHKQWFLSSRRPPRVQDAFVFVIVFVFVGSCVLFKNDSEDIARSTYNVPEPKLLQLVPVLAGLVFVSSLSVSLSLSVFVKK